MVDVAQLSIKVDTTDLARGEAALESLGKEGARVERSTSRAAGGVKKLGAATASAGALSGNFGRQIQNASFQVGDFAVQVASGTAASRALAQQLPQLLGGFGVLGAVLGAVAAIGGALVPVLFSLRDGAEGFDDILGDIESTAGSIKRELTALKTLQGEYSAAVVRGQDDIAAALAQEIELRGKLLEFKRLELEQRQQNLETSLKEAEAAFNNVLEEAQQAASIIDRDLTNAQFTRTRGQREALDAARAVLSENETITTEYQKQQTEAELVALQISEVDRLLESAAGNAGGVAAGLSAAAVAASQAAAALSAQQIFDRANKQYSGRGGDPTQQVSTIGPDGIQKLIDAQSGVSGRSPADTFANDLEALRKRLRTEQEVIQEEYERSKALLADQRAQEILGEQEHRDALLDVEREYQDKLRSIRMARQDETLGYTASFFGAMAQATAAGGDKLVKASQAFGAIEATVNAYRAAAQVLADPSVPFWGKAAAYAQVLATGLGAVSAIRGAASGGGSAAPVAAATQANTSARVALTLVGSENATFTKQQVRDLINQINEATEDGAIVRVA